MSDSPSTRVTMDEEMPLNLVAGSGDEQNNDNCHQVVSSKGRRAFPTCSCDDNHHRKLAICSIICGISCIGIKSLINSVKAERTENTVEAAEFSRRAKKYGIMSITIWVLILCLIPILMALVSYLFTLID